MSNHNHLVIVVTSENDVTRIQKSRGMLTNIRDIG